MKELQFEIDEGLNVDFISGRVATKSVFVKSGSRRGDNFCWVSIETIRQINNFLIKNGIPVN